MDIILIIIWILIIAGWFLYKRAKIVYEELESYGIPYEGAINSYWGIIELLLMKRHFFYLIDDQYKKFKGQQIVPAFNLSQRSFMARDAEIIKQITIKDFDSFVNHDQSFNGDIDSLQGKMLFTLVDDEWRNMRNTLSPIFTSSKMKMMFGILSDCASDFMVHYEKKVKETGKLVINSKETFSRFTVDGICSAVLGFKGDCVENEDSELYKLSVRMQPVDIWSTFKFLLFFFFANIYKFFKFQLTTKEIRDFFYNAIVKVMKEREQNGTFRPDVIQLLMQAKKGQLKVQDKENEVNEAELSNFSANIEYDVKAKNTKLTNWTDEHYMAQGFIFFFAGYDTTQTLLQVTTYSLAKNKDVQQKLIDEVDEVVASLGDASISYETLHKMQYLDMVISEALRYWPPASATTRGCNRDYDLKLNNGKVIKMKPGDDVSLPIYSIQHDPKYFEDPEKFDPERFSDERKGSIVDGSYIPFGYGPRVCIGSRFALMEAKLLIFNLLRKFTFEVCDKTPEKFELAPNFANFELKEKIFIELKLRN
ncbi:unnamed protein product [Chironomus riparius]|uniref:Cytochrome P450 n=1 Tax=Chironomus riparius TaxID=315576 RepID=A0A9N9WYT8_9DIPT|nr:unnamed protein product [Chironomus riparius]